LTQKILTKHQIWIEDLSTNERLYLTGIVKSAEWIWSKYGGCMQAILDLDLKRTNRSYLANANFLELTIQIKNELSGVHEDWFVGRIKDHYPINDGLNNEYIRLIARGYVYELDEIKHTEIYINDDITDIVKDLIQNHIAPDSSIIYDAANFDNTGITLDEFRVCRTVRETLEVLSKCVPHFTWGVGTDKKFFWQNTSSGKQYNLQNVIAYKDQHSHQIKNRFVLFGGIKDNALLYERIHNDAASQATYDVKTLQVYMPEVVTDTVADQILGYMADALADLPPQTLICHIRSIADKIEASKPIKYIQVQDNEGNNLNTTLGFYDVRYLLKVDGNVDAIVNSGIRRHDLENRLRVIENTIRAKYEVDKILAITVSKGFDITSNDLVYNFRNSFDFVWMASDVEKFRFDSSVPRFDYYAPARYLPSATGTQDIISITPSNPLVENSTWVGLHIYPSALDPATGIASAIFGTNIDYAGTASVDGNTGIIGHSVRGAPSDNSEGYEFRLYEMTANKVQTSFVSDGASLILSATATYRGVNIDWDGLTCDNASSPILEGVRVDLPANYAAGAGFGSSFAGYFSGDGRSVTICDTTNALYVIGTSYFSDNILMADGKYIGIDGAERIHFDASNNYIQMMGAYVGINNAAPSSPLDVVLTGSGVVAEFESGGAESSIQIRNDAVTFKYGVYDFGTGDDQFFIYDGAADAMKLSVGGNVWFAGTITTTIVNANKFNSSYSGTNDAFYCVQGANTDTGRSIALHHKGAGRFAEAYFDAAGWQLKWGLDNAGGMWIAGKLTQAGCEIFTEDAIGIIEDVMSKGTGEFDEFGHEKFDEKWIHKKYPYLAKELKYDELDNERKKTSKLKTVYGENISARCDLLYRAFQQQVEINKDLQRQITELQSLN